MCRARCDGLERPLPLFDRNRPTLTRSRHTRAGGMPRAPTLANVRRKARRRCARVLDAKNAVLHNRPAESNASRSETYKPPAPAAPAPAMPRAARGVQRILATCIVHWCQAGTRRLASWRFGYVAKITLSPGSHFSNTPVSGWVRGVLPRAACNRAGGGDAGVPLKLAGTSFAAHRHAAAGRTSTHMSGSGTGSAVDWKTGRA